MTHFPWKSTNLNLNPYTKSKIFLVNANPLSDRAWNYDGPSTCNESLCRIFWAPLEYFGRYFIFTEHSWNPSTQNDWKWGCQFEKMAYFTGSTVVSKVWNFQCLFIGAAYSFIFVTVSKNMRIKTPLLGFSMDSYETEEGANPKLTNNLNFLLFALLYFYFCRVPSMYELKWQLERFQSKIATCRSNISVNFWANSEI